MKQLLGFVLSFCILYTATLPFAKKSDAAVGLIIKHRTTATVGGLSAGGGILFSSLIYGAAMSSGATGWGAVAVGINAAVYISLGLTIGVLGLIALDDKTVSDFKFLPIENMDPAYAKEIAVYNSELDMLNAIKESIESEVDADKDVDTKALWNEYSQFLSPETFKIAQSIADGFMKKLEPIK